MLVHLFVYIYICFSWSLYITTMQKCVHACLYACVYKCVCAFHLISFSFIQTPFVSALLHLSKWVVLRGGQQQMSCEADIHDCAVNLCIIHAMNLLLESCGILFHERHYYTQVWHCLCGTHAVLMKILTKTQDTHL